MAQLRLAAVTKRYNGKQTVDALKPVDLDFEDGEFITILGPSGSGKTTLLSIIVGVVEPTAGRVLLDGTDVTYADPRDRDNMAMVFQNYALYPSKTVSGNLQFPLRMQKMPREDRQAKVEAMAELLDLSDYIDRYPRELSGGQQQRVALGRALIRQPKLFLMDEPLSNLDAKLRLQMRTEIKRLHREYPVTTIYVTHDQSEAMALSDRVVVMNQGTIAQVGTPQDIYRRPADTFVATFVGTPAMNLLPVTLHPHGPELTCVSDEGTPLASIPVERVATPVPTQAQLGIRPAHVTWTHNIDGTEGRSAPAVVHEVDALGEDTIIHARLGQGSLTIVERDGRQPDPGQEIQVRFPTNAVQLFTHDNGQALTRQPNEARPEREHSTAP